MTERPILFSAPMVRAILAGEKTQTRRLVKYRCRWSIDERWPPGERWPFDPTWAHGDDGSPWLPCPYGAPGDRLWVREAFRLRAEQDDKPPSEGWKKSAWYYEADGNCKPSGCGGGAGKLRPSIYMPRWASRITLEVTSVRVERLQQISEDEARAEGVTFSDFGLGEGICSDQRLAGDERERTKGTHPHTLSFAVLWDTINGDRATWASNPWVWAVSFRRIAP